MDMNARKTAEQLDAVASFVVVKQFPENMARRIRRHFRRFYSLKSAIDESKIFSELSAGLRKEVSEYLVVELMGKESFFMTMPNTLWPRLLPLLRPMAFDKDEIVCTAGEESTDVYVVESGLFAATMQVEGERGVRTRYVGMGGAVNSLHGLGIWFRCLETVTAMGAVQSYAVSAVDFASLFSTEADRENYAKMQKRERRNFLMDPTAPSAQASWGRPVCHTCFTLVDVAFVCLKIFQGGGGKADALDQSVYAVVDLVDVATGKPFGGLVGELWKLKTAKASAKTANLDQDLDGDGEPDGFEEVFIGEEVRWSDITSAFDACALRVRLIAAGARGRDTVIGRTALRLADFDADLASPLQPLPRGGTPRTLSVVEASSVDEWCASRPLRDGEFDVWCNLGNAAAAAAAAAAAEVDPNISHVDTKASFAAPSLGMSDMGMSSFCDEIPEGASGAWAKLRVLARRPNRRRRATAGAFTKRSKQAPALSVTNHVGTFADRTGVQMALTCLCSNFFKEDSVFCRKCGAQRMQAEEERGNLSSAAPSSGVDIEMV